MLRLFRKFLFALVLGLHLTPGRRLIATLEKYQLCRTVQNPQDMMVQSLLDVLHSKGLSNSLKKLGAIVGGSKDGERGFVETNTGGLLKALVDRLVSCNDYKMMDMGIRYEIKLEVKEMFKGDCQHNKSTVREDRIFALLVNWENGEILTFAQLQSYLDKAMKYEENEACSLCGKSTVKTVQSLVKEFCDPDFLTIAFARPVNLNAGLSPDGGVSNYGASLYMVKSVVQWDASRRCASVSRETEEGWWWHGVDESQAPDFKYSTEQMRSSAYLSNVTVLMMVRMGERCDQPVTRQEAPNWNNKNGKERNETRDENDGIQNLNHLSHVSSKGCDLDEKNNKGSKVQQVKKDGEDCQRKSLQGVSTSAVVVPISSTNVQLEKDLAQAKAISLSTGMDRSAGEALFQQDLALAQTLSLKDNPNLLRPEEVVRKGIAFAAWSLKILCRRPGIQVELDGNCLWIALCHAIDPNLQGEALKQAAWQLRLESMGAALEQLKDMMDDGWQWLQAVSVGKDEETLTRDEIKHEMNKYMDSGIYGGNLGDILPHSAATRLARPIVIIEIKDGKVTNANLVKPGMIFQCENEKDEPFILVKQQDHFVPLLVDDVARDTAKEKYRQWKTLGRVDIVGQSCEVGKDGEMRQRTECNNRVDQSGEKGSTSGFYGVVQCNCGYKGAIANHLRAFQHCLQSIRNELSLGTEMSDDVLIVKATLLLLGCPALSCPDGPHDVIPESCVQWWKECGFDLMQWEEQFEDINSTLIKEKARKFVTDLTKRYDEQHKDMSQTDDENSNKSRWNGSMEQRSMADADGIFSPPVVSTPKQQQHQDIFQQEQSGDPLPEMQDVQCRRKVKISQIVQGRHLCICGFEGPLANHLRESNQCVAELKKESILQFQGSDELFIVKATLTFKGCPALLCPGGDHRKTMPVACVNWWKEVGGRLMRWSKFGKDSTRETIMHKINDFLTNSKKRYHLVQEVSNSECTSSENISQPDSSASPKDRCPFCHFEGCLAQHLRNQAPCLALLIAKELKNRVAFYAGKDRLAIFDLGILLSFCPNPHCSKSLTGKGVTKHARGTCLQFYQREGESLYKWDRNLTSDSVAVKWRDRKSWLNKCARKAAENKLCNYLSSVAIQLTKVCSNCCVQGPLLGIKEHELEIAGWNEISNKPLWLCGSCKNQNEKHLEMIRFAEERVALLSKARPKEESALKAIEIEDPVRNTSRVVFMPADVAGENPPVERDELLPLSATVLVPINPEALDCFSDEVFEEAKNDINALESLTEFSARRPFFVKPTLLLSVFWRMKQAQIRLERLSMLKSLKETAKGKITSRDPNIANVVDRNPHYAVTQKFCLTSTCSWSSGAKVKRSDESAARSSINGQVKMSVRITLLKQGAECPELANIIKEAVDAHGPRPPMYLAPVVLCFVYGKLKLLMKHILTPAYKNWDLQLRFHPGEWTVEVVGYLYSRQFEEVNVNIAQHGLTHDEMMKQILLDQSLLPSVCLDVKEIAEIYSLDEDRAQVRNISPSHCTQITSY